MMEEVERMVFQETVSAEMVRLVNDAAGVAVEKILRPQSKTTF